MNSSCLGRLRCVHLTHKHLDFYFESFSTKEESLFCLRRTKEPKLDYKEESETFEAVKVTVVTDSGDESRRCVSSREDECVRSCFSPHKYFILA